MVCGHEEVLSRVGDVLPTRLQALRYESETYAFNGRFRCPFEVRIGRRIPPVVEPALARMGAPLAPAGSRGTISGIFITNSPNQEQGGVA